MAQKSKATHYDAELILRLYDLRREEKLREARAWFASAFHAESLQEVMQKYPPHSEESRMFRMVVTYWDMAASFVAAGIIDEALFFENNREMLLVWERIRHMVEDARKAFRDEMLYRNLEKAAGAFIDFLDKEAPGTYAAFAERVAKPRG